MSIATRGVQLGAVVVMLGGLLACRSPSVTDLSATAHGVPVPDGLTVTHEGASQNESVGKTTKEYDVTYANTSRSCSQLLADWETALQRAHRAFTPPPAGGRQIFLSDNGLIVFIDVGLVSAGACRTPSVDVQETP